MLHFVAAEYRLSRSLNCCMFVNWLCRFVLATWKLTCDYLTSFAGPNPLGDLLQVSHGRAAHGTLLLQQLNVWTQPKAPNKTIALTVTGYGIRDHPQMFEPIVHAVFDYDRPWLQGGVQTLRVTLLHCGRRRGRWRERIGFAWSHSLFGGNTGSLLWERGMSMHDLTLIYSLTLPLH